MGGADDVRKLRACTCRAIVLLAAVIGACAGRSPTDRTAQADDPQATPPIPERPTEMFGTRGDTLRYPLTRPFADPEDLSRYYRNLAGILFHDDVDAAGFWAVLRRHGGRIVGGYSNIGMWAVEIPDPGPTFEDLERALDAIRAEPAVDLAVPVAHRMIVNPDRRRRGGFSALLRHSFPPWRLLAT